MKKKITTSASIIAISIFYILPLLAQTESKVAVLTISGSGKTQDEAKQNALRNAIEQTFGTFISSNTQILNDQLVKDEIVSVSSGNIREYSVLSEVQTPDGNWSNTIKATVSIDKLTLFCESKGVTAELKGSLFALNIKLQELNTVNEITAIANMSVVVKEIMNKAFDFEINVKDPTGDSGVYMLPLQFVVKANDNFYKFEDYLINTLKGLSLPQTEIENIRKTGGKTYCLKYSKIKCTETLDFYFRSPVSLIKIYDIILYMRKAMLSFTIESEFFKIDGDVLWDTYMGTSSAREKFGRKGFKSPIVGAAGGGGIFSEFDHFYFDTPDDRYKADFNMYKYKSLRKYESNADQIFSYPSYNNCIQIDFCNSDPNILFAYAFDYAATLEAISKINKITIKPKLITESDSYDAQYNLGVENLNKTIELIKKADKITDVAQYNKAEEEALAAYIITITYFEKANSLEPNEADPLIYLMEIYKTLKAVKPEYEAKYNEIVKKLEIIQKKY